MCFTSPEQVRQPPLVPPATQPVNGANLKRRSRRSRPRSTSSRGCPASQIPSRARAARAWGEAGALPAPRSIGILRMRPVVLSLTACPSRRSRTAILAFAPHRVVPAHPLDRRDQGGCPLGRRAPRQRRTASRLRACFAMLRVAKTRCQGGSSCNLSRQAEGLHGGPPSRCLFNTNSVGDPHPSFKDRVSLLSERGQHRVSQGALHGRAAAPPSTVHFLRLLQRTRRNRVLAPHNLMAAGRCAARASVIFVLPPCSDLSNLQSDRLPGAG